MRKLHLQSFIYILADIVLIFGITFLAFFGSYSEDIFNSSLTGILLYCGGSALVTVIMFAILKLYHMAYENFGLADSVRVAVGYSIPVSAGLIVLLTVDGLHFEVNHIIVWFLVSATILFALTIIRALPREIKTLHRMIEKRKLGVRTMVIGAGDAAKIVIDDSRNNLKSKNNIVVLVDDDEKKFGSIYSNIKVTGPISNVSKIVEDYQIEEAIIVIANLTEERLHEIVDYLSACNVRIRRLSLLSEMSGPNDIKVVDVHIEELLNRDPIKLDNTEVTLSATDLAGMLSINEFGLPSLDENGNLLIDKQVVKDGLYDALSPYNTYHNHTFTTDDGRQVYLATGTYGNEINIDAVADDFYEALSSGNKNYYCVPEYKNKANFTGDNDIGNTYVEVSLDEQKLFYFENGVIKLTSDVVTGNKSYHYDTPEGVYAVFVKQKNRTLVGETYRSFVKYWIEFYPHYGLHDASWRKEGAFGGDIYLTNGSHGCVNMPTEKVAEAYDLIEKGTPVIVYSYSNSKVK